MPDVDDAAADGPLRDKLLERCLASDANANEIVEALVDALMISIIAAGPDVDSAERNILAITDDMVDNVRTAFAAYQQRGCEKRGGALR